jgi:hypothetical protein
LFLQETSLSIRRTTADTLSQILLAGHNRPRHGCPAARRVLNTLCLQLGNQRTANLLDEGVADTLGLVGEAGASITAPMAGEFLAQRHAPIAAVFIAPASSS